ncbi:MAG: helix-turn-helix domain-containing protein [Caldilineaceae bacterium]|nr:helix-turn-helix domain-containing protein [Caldilineaceae bacterium]
MTILFEERSSDSPYIETVMQGYTACDGASVRPAESCWHMVFVREHGRFHPLVVGPLTTAGVAHYGEGAEILWIKFKLGAFMPHLPARAFLDTEAALPGAARQSFWLKSSTWQSPTYETVETFVDRLVRDEVLVRDPVVHAALQEQPPALSPRALRHRFLQATGLSQNHIGQVERAQRAAAFLRQGRSILDTVEEAGYFDQPHLTRALKRWVGHTPAQIARQGRPASVAAPVE